MQYTLSGWTVKQELCRWMPWWQNYIPKWHHSHEKVSQSVICVFTCICPDIFVILLLLLLLFLLEVFDAEHANAVTEHIPFYKFALGLWNYCTLDDIDLGRYILCYCCCYCSLCEYCWWQTDSLENCYVDCSVIIWLCDCVTVWLWLCEYVSFIQRDWCAWVSMIIPTTANINDNID